MAQGNTSVVLAVAACLAISAAYRLNEPCPHIVTRQQWGARPQNGPVSPLAISPAPFVVIHHGGTRTYCYTQEECSRIARAYQNYHIDTNGWSDIGYNFLVGEDGNVYEGRGWDVTGAHAPPLNNQSIGICVIGDFTERAPNEAALAAVQQLVACGVRQADISSQYRLVGHRQVRATECPGEAFYRLVVAMPHWDSHPAPLPTSPAVTTDTPSSSVNIV